MQAEQTTEIAEGTGLVRAMRPEPLEIARQLSVRGYRSEFKVLVGHWPLLPPVRWLSG